MELKRITSSTIIPIKLQSRTGKASNHLYNNLYANFSSPIKSKPDSPSIESITDPYPLNPSPTLKSVKPSTRKHKKLPDKTTAVFKSVTRKDKINSIYNKPASLDPGWYHPKFELVFRRSNRAPEFKAETKTKSNKKLLLPYCMEQNLECRYTQMHHTECSIKTNELYSTLDLIRRSPIEFEKYDELLERKSRDLSLGFGSKTSPRIPNLVDFNKQTSRSFKEKGANPERFNYIPSTSPIISSNKRTISVDFQKMPKRSTAFESIYTEKRYKPNIDFIKPKTAILVPFDKQLPRKLESSISQASPRNLKLLEKGFYKLGHIKSVQSLPLWDSMEGRSKTVLAKASPVQTLYNSIDDMEMKKFILMHLSRY